MAADLEGELAKARAIQSEATGLRQREMEQAVVSVFLSSQPIGQKALTQELVVLVGAANPDKIELEKALHRWTEVSWFSMKWRSGQRKGPRTARGIYRMRGDWATVPTCARCTTTLAQTECSPLWWSRNSLTPSRSRGPSRRAPRRLAQECTTFRTGRAT